MKKNGFFAIFTAITVIFAMGIFSGCIIGGDFGNGRIISQERTVSGFNKVKMEGVGDVTIHPGVQYHGQDYAAIVTTDSNIQDVVTVSVDGSTLFINTKRHINFIPTKLSVDIYTPELHSVSLKGVGDIEVGSGSTANLKLSLSGVGDIKAQKYEAQNVEVQFSGTGDVKTWATTTLTGKLSGVGNILYRGSPTINVEKTGIGQVKKL